MLPELRRDLFGMNENRKFYAVSSLAHWISELMSLTRISEIEGNILHPQSPIPSHRICNHRPKCTKTFVYLCPSGNTVDTVTSCETWNDTHGGEKRLQW